ncbi:MAG TPA: Hsp20/alpha crystallin family protein [Nitrososphaeraceae archaeon]|nr:Hsp20/alpha crystallin family protein [Nitrososphaeraceae archaeon]
MLTDNLYLDSTYNTLPTLMNDWTRFIEKWFNESQIAFVDYEFDRQELLLGFNELTEDFDRVFNDDPNELEFSESYMRVRSKNVIKELILVHSSYPLDLRLNKNTRKNKTRKSLKPAPVQRRNRLNSYRYNLTDDSNIAGSEIPLSRAEKEGREYFDDVIVTDENIKAVTQLPINNRRENIQVIAYSDNSVSISYLNSEGKRSSRALALPYSIDIETAKSTYRNGILEITFNKK